MQRLKVLIPTILGFVLTPACIDLVPGKFYTLEIVPPADGAEVHTVKRGASVVVVIRIINGRNVDTELDVTLSPPSGVRTSWDDNMTKKLYLDPDEVVDYPVTISVGAEQALGPLTFGVHASGSSEIANQPGDDVSDSQSATFDVLVTDDEQAPTVAIQRPIDGASFDRLPVTARASATDDNDIRGMSYVLNQGLSRSAAIEKATSAVGATAEMQADLVDLVLGINTLDVEVTDAVGRRASRSVRFNYAPSGICENMIVTAAPVEMVGVPGSRVETTLTITPVGGWSGWVDIRAPGIGALSTSQGFDPGFQLNIAEALPVIMGINLRDDVVPGTRYEFLLRVEDRGDRINVCDLVLTMDIADPLTRPGPTVIIERPIDGAVLTSPEITLTGQALSDGAITRVYYTHNTFIENELYQGSSRDPVEFNTTLTLEEGDNYIRVSAVDDVGQVTTEIVVVTYEPAPTGECTDFTIAVSPNSASVGVGQSDTRGVIITRPAGVESSVTLSLDEPFANEMFSRVTFGPNPTTGNAELELHVTEDPSITSDLIGNTFTLTVVGQSSGSRCTATFSIAVTP